MGLIQWSETHPYKASALSGLVLAFCHPFVSPGHSGPPHLPIVGALLALVAFVPYLAALEAAKKKRTIIVSTYLCFGLQLGVSVYWLDVAIHRYGGLPHIVSVLAISAIALITGTYLALAVLSGCWAAKRMKCSRALVLPFFWLVGDAIRGAWIYGYPLSGFPWAHVSATQAENPWLRPLLSLGGIELLALWVFAFNLVALRTVQGRFNRRQIVLNLTILVGVPALWSGAWHHHVNQAMAQAKTHQFGLIQGNLSQDLKNDLRNRGRYMLNVQRRLSAELAAQQPDAIIWSEVTYPFALNRDAPRLGARQLGYGPGAPPPKLSLVGAMVGWEQSEGTCQANDDCNRGESCRQGLCRNYLIHNSLVALDRDLQMLGRADKYHLVPFGEYVPGRSVLGLLGIDKLVPVAGRMRPAETIQPIETPLGKIGGLICYEGVFPVASLRLVEQGASLLVNPTNDTWYGATSGPWQHLEFYRMRALETGRPILRVANSGISGWFDPLGRAYDLTALNEESATIVNVNRAVVDTPYVRLGGAPSWFILAVAPFLLIFARLRRRDPEATDKP